MTNLFSYCKKEKHEWNDAKIFSDKRMVAQCDLCGLFCDTNGNMYNEYGEKI